MKRAAAFIYAYLRAFGRFLRGKVAPLLREVFLDFQRDNVVMLSASLSYFAFFSLFPLLLLTLSGIGLVLGSEDSLARQVLQVVMSDASDETISEIDAEIDAYTQVVAFARSAISPDVAQLIDETLQRLNIGGVEAGLTGIIILFWVASNIFGQLDWSFQLIWGIYANQPSAPPCRTVILNFVKRRLLAVLLVMLSALLIMISLFTRAAITLVRNIVPEFLQHGGWEPIYFMSGFVLFFLIVVTLFKYLPHTRITWGDVWIGALITTTLISLLVNLSSWFIGNRNLLAYGVVGSIMALLFWIYLTSMAIYLGAEFTQVYTRMYGSQRRSEEG